MVSKLRQPGGRVRVSERDPRLRRHGIDPPLGMLGDQAVEHCDLQRGQVSRSLGAVEHAHHEEVAGQREEYRRALEAEPDLAIEG